MRNSLLLSISLLFINSFLLADNLTIESKNITLDKNKLNSVFENEVIVKTDDNKTIKSDYAEYNKKKGFILLKSNVSAIDSSNNIIETNEAIYYEKSKIFKSFGPTKIVTAENYIINGNNITLDNNKNFIFSDENTSVTDEDDNKILLENFRYEIESNIFKSIGSIKINDKTDNAYQFSQIYIDTKKKEILGTDIKAFLNDKNLKIDEENKPRVFANTLRMNKEKSSFSKSIFTLCNYRENDKCPPWTIQASEMLHDSKKKNDLLW